MTTATEATTLNINSADHKGMIDIFIKMHKNGTEMKGEVDWAQVDSEGFVTSVTKATIKKIFVRNTDVVVRLNGFNVRASRYQMLDHNEASKLKRQFEGQHQQMMMEYLRRIAEDHRKDAKQARKDVQAALADGKAMDYVFKYRCDIAVKAEQYLNIALAIENVFRNLKRSEQREALEELYRSTLSRYISCPPRHASSSSLSNFVDGMQHEVDATWLREMQTCLMISSK